MAGSDSDGSHDGDLTKRPGLPPGTQRFTMGVDVTTIRGQLKRADAGKFTFYCDEPPRIGGEDAYPQPLTYLAAAAGF